LGGSILCLETSVALSGTTFPFNTTDNRIWPNPANYKKSTRYDPIPPYDPDFDVTDPDYDIDTYLEAGYQFPANDITDFIELTMAHTPGGTAIPTAQLPPPPPPPQPMTPDQLLAAIAQSQAMMTQHIGTLTQAMATMTQGIATMAAARPTINVSTQALEKPEKYKGKIGPDARRFLTSFTVWAASTQGHMNQQQADGSYLRDDQIWIRTALTFMQGDAAIWAQPFLEDYMKAVSNPPTALFPFRGDWNVFRDAFLKRWDSPAEKQEAIEALHLLSMDKDTAATYTAKFKEIAQRTGFGADDLRYRYHMGLSKKLKDALAITDKPQSTIDELAQTACEIDQRMRANSAEQAMREGRAVPRGHNTIIDTYLKKSHPATDPDAMDVDATNIMASILNPEQKKKWAEMMKGRCYACTSNRHQSKDCPVKKDKFKCEHCTLAGHNMRACLRRFAGQPRGPPPTRRAAVVRVEEEAEVESEEEPEFLDPEPSQEPSAEVGEMVSVAATTSGKKKRQRKKKPATSNPGAKAPDAASVASTSSSALPPKPTEKSLFGGGPSLAPGPWAATVETAEKRRAEKQQLQRDIAALKARLAESDEDDDSEYLPRMNF
jgi:hypothetical protein